MSPSARRLIPFLGALALALCVASPALAHADLVSSDPADSSTLAEPPAVVTLTFSEGLDPGRSSLRLIGPGGTVGTAKPARDGAKVMALEGLTLGAGAYTVRWTAGAADGHVERGTVRFTVLEPIASSGTGSPAPGTVASAAAPELPSGAPSGAPGTPSAGSVTITPSAEPADSVAPGMDADPAANAGSGTDILVVVVAALALVAGLGAWILRRNRGA